MRSINTIAFSINLQIIVFINIIILILYFYYMNRIKNNDFYCAEIYHPESEKCILVS